MHFVRGNADHRTRRIRAIVQRIDLREIDVAKGQRIVRLSVRADVRFHRVGESADAVVVIIRKAGAEQNVT